MATYTWQADDRAVATATRDVFNLLFLARPGARWILGTLAGSLAVLGALSFVGGTFPTQLIVLLGVFFTLSFVALWYQSSTIANALFGDRTTWTATYLPDQLLLETAEGTCRLGYAELTAHAASGGLHGWTISRRRRVFVPAALVPAEALGWIASGRGPEVPAPRV